ncbi:class I SAM-dependent methyltransferase [candidate division WOR-3 bacterium]|nr:class I SAM-dependent methyltransferase [candidate division WOR-3 bacterium]
MSKEKPIFDIEEVFEPDDYLYFYENSLTEERTKKQIEFLVKELELDKPMEILDLACGHGRHANHLAELGQNVTGVDITPGFLEIAKREAKKKGLTVEYIQGDMRKISYTEKFDRVLLLYTSFGYFEDEENFKVLKNVERALKPKGLFCFDIHNRDVCLKHFLPYSVTEKENNLMIDRCTFDSDTGHFYNRRIVIRNGKRKDKPFFVRFYNPSEIRDLLKRAGFRKCKIYGNWDGNLLTSDSRRMIIITDK